MAFKRVHRTAGRPQRIYSAWVNFVAADNELFKNCLKQLNE